ncbi:hypothetical protein BD289DRAFT_483052 [Coniella lustricola]|uniref:Exonuclease domain-containing protein n=1 Tax=Coniella lustricola TaxID=2025994 RepID=A0A2T3A6Q1_9PEZI|nr:hypothetical protein BD289DRAFT_483052 [Coniella lustricola]
MAGAVPIFNGLKHLSCPGEAAGKTCTTPGCLFGHARDRDSSKTAAKDGLANGDHEAPPSKRQRTQVQDAPFEESGGGVAASNLVAKVQSSGVYDPLSPPVAAKTPCTPPSRKKAASPSRSKIVKPPSQNAAGPSSQRASALRKVESLNPRHLKAAPAAHGVRHKLLSLLHADYSRLNKEVSIKAAADAELKSLLLSPQDLIWMALDREHELATQRPTLYNNAMRHEVTRYKKMQVTAWIAERKKSLEKKLAPSKTPVNDSPVVIDTGLTPAEEIIVARRLIPPMKGLDEYGYVLEPPTEEQIRETKQAVEWSKGWEQCDRCTARFQIFPGRNIETGELASGGTCTHHPGKTYMPQRELGGWVSKKYRCCNQDMGESPGCTVGATHVWMTRDPKRLASLWPFVETPANNSPLVKEAVAFDCEMAFTVQGLEVVRLTATSWPDGAMLLDVLVQPYGEILDLISQYSGVWPEDMANAVPWTRDGTAPPQQGGQRKILQKVSSPDIARGLLFEFINSDTMLIGHALENDLKAMRIIHHNIVDTVLLYPHKFGLPARSSLKVLMEALLRRQIQQLTDKGHDSAEDARAAGDLVRFKVQKEWQRMKMQGWTWVDGVLRPKGWKPEASEAIPTLQEQSGAESIDTDDQASPLKEDSPQAFKS